MKAFAVLALASAAMAAPDCDVNIVDRCLTKVLPYANRTMLGLTPKEFEDECQRDREAIKCVRGYLDLGCFKGDKLASFKYLVADLAKESALRCQEGTERYEAYFKYVPCANKAGKQLNRCLRRTTAYIEAAAGAGETRAAQTCCAFDQLETCLGVAVADECDQAVGGYLKDVLRGVTGRFVGAQCGVYQFGSAECKALPTLAFDEPKYTTLFGPLAQFLASE